MVLAEVTAVAVAMAGVGLLVGLFGFGVFLLGLPWGSSSSNGTALALGVMFMLAGLLGLGMAALMAATGVGSPGPVARGVRRGEVTIVDEHCAVSGEGVALATGQVLNDTGAELDLLVDYTFTLPDGSEVEVVRQRYAVPARSRVPFAVSVEVGGGPPGAVPCRARLHDA